MDSTATIKRVRFKRSDVHQLSNQILALSASGLNHTQIATKLNVSTKTVQRHMSIIRPDLHAAQSLLDDLDSRLAQLQSPGKIAEVYVNYAEHAKNEAVGLAAQDRILELRGVITDRERMRIEKSQAQPHIQPMFQLAAGSTLNVTVQQSVTERNVTPGNSDVTDHNSDE